MHRPETRGVMAMRFRNRTEAGRALARALGALSTERPIVLATPRGGVPVGCEVAWGLGAPMDVIVIRKVEAPGHPGRIVGALGEGGVLVPDAAAVRDLGLAAEDLERIAAGEKREVDRWIWRYRGARPLPDVEGRCAIVVDEGISSGRSARAAARMLRARHAGRIVIAVPVAARDAAERVRPEVDGLVCLQVPDELIAVGYWYGQARPSDDEALAVLERSRARARELAAAGPALRASGPAPARVAIPR